MPAIGTPPCRRLGYGTRLACRDVVIVSASAPEEICAQRATLERGELAQRCGRSDDGACRVAVWPERRGLTHRSARPTDARKGRPFRALFCRVPGPASQSPLSMLRPLPNSGARPRPTAGAGSREKPDGGTRASRRGPPERRVRTRTWICSRRTSPRCVGRARGRRAGDQGPGRERRGHRQTTAGRGGRPVHRRGPSRWPTRPPASPRIRSPSWSPASARSR